MTISVVFAIAGVMALLFGIIGGGVKAREIEVPLLSLPARIITTVVGILLVGVAFWQESYGKAQFTPVEISLPAASTSIPPTIALTPSQTEVNENMIFTLVNATSADFYSIQDATYFLQNDGSLMLTGSYAQGIYPNRSLPNNFRVIIQFRTKHQEDEFILGLSDGEKMRPNYHFVMTSDAASFKQQLGFDINDNWDKYIKSNSNILIKPDITYKVVFERINGSVSINVNNVSLFGFGAPDVAEIGNYDHLYITGAEQQQLIIESLVIEQAE